MSAKDNFYKGYNCAQAVAVAFADEIGLDKDSIAKMVSGFGGGISRLRETCGAVSGMVFVANMLYGYSDSGDYAAKAEHYKRIRTLVERYRDEVGAIRCCEILKNVTVGGDPEERTSEYYKRRICPDLCEIAESILRDYISGCDK